MKKFKASLAAILAACSLLGISGCSENREQSSNLSGSNVDSSDIGQSSDLSNSGDSQSSESNGSSQSSDSGSTDSSNDGSQGSEQNSGDSGEVEKTQYSPIAITDNNTVNSIRLFDAIIKDNENAMFSPLSLNMALGMLESGAAGETEAQINSYLQTANYADFAKNYMKRAKNDLTKEAREGDYREYSYLPKSAVEIANSFWASDSIPFNDSYKQTVSDKFGAEIQNVNFADKTETLKKINGWVNEKTYEMIPAVLSERDINDRTAAVLINTVYFESAWDQHKWFIDESEKESFTLLDGTAKDIPLMHSYGDKYFENDNASAFARKYLNGTEFIGILPKKNGDFTLEELDIPSLLKNDRSSDYDEISAVMPRLNFESNFPLKDALIAAGMEEMFDENNADLPGISSYPLYVSNVIQKTKLELDEKGTKAAAATAIVLGAGGGGYDEPPKIAEVRLDRPFAFLIYDSAKEQILFMGKVTNP